MVRPSLPLVVLALTLSGCTDLSDSVDVDECAGDADQDDVTAIAWDFDQSAHEMITCGGLRSQLIRSLINSATSLLSDPEALPDAFSYADGIYNTQGVGVSMDLWFRYGADSPVGSAGETVTDNLFDPDSFLVGADAVDNGDGTVTVSFTEPGPLAAMLGKGDSPESPLVLTDADAAVFAANLGSLEIVGSIFVDDPRDPSLIVYELSNPAQAVVEAFMGQTLSMEMIDAGGGREDLNQTLVATRWDVAYADVAGALDGVIELEVTGGPFDFQATYTYLPTDPWPLVVVTCLD